VGHSHRMLYVPECAGVGIVGIYQVSTPTAASIFKPMALAIAEFQKEKGEVQGSVILRKCEASYHTCIVNFLLTCFLRWISKIPAPRLVGARIVLQGGHGRMEHVC